MKNIDFKKIMILFTIGGTLGWILETLFTYIKYQHYIVKKGMVLGIFKPLYGIGLIIFYFVYLFLKKRRISKSLYFFIGIIVGTIYEYLASMFETYILHTNTWDYSNFSLNLNGRVFLPYMIIWGILFLLVTTLFPLFDKFYDNYITKKIVKFLVIFLAIFMSFNLFLTTCVFVRYSMRNKDVKPLSFIGEVIDYKFNDEYIKETFPRLRIVE